MNKSATLVNPVHRMEQTVSNAIAEITGSDQNELNAERIRFDQVRMAVEIVFGLTDLKRKTNLVPYPEAREMFVKLVYRNFSYSEERIMNYLGKNRTSFYHNITRFENLLFSDKEYKRKYNELLNKLGL